MTISTQSRCVRLIDTCRLLEDNGVSSNGAVRGRADLQPTTEAKNEARLHHDRIESGQGAGWIGAPWGCRNLARSEQAEDAATEAGARQDLQRRRSPASPPNFVDQHFAAIAYNAISRDRDTNSVPSVTRRGSLLPRVGTLSCYRRDNANRCALKDQPSAMPANLPTYTVNVTDHPSLSMPVSALTVVPVTNTTTAATRTLTRSRYHYAPTCGTVEPSYGQGSNRFQNGPRRTLRRMGAGVAFSRAQ